MAVGFKVYDKCTIFGQILSSNNQSGEKPKYHQDCCMLSFCTRVCTVCTRTIHHDVQTLLEASLLHCRRDCVALLLWVSEANIHDRMNKIIHIVTSNILLSWKHMDQTNHNTHFLIDWICLGNIKSPINGHTWTGHHNMNAMPQGWLG